MYTANCTQRSKLAKFSSSSKLDKSKVYKLNRIKWKMVQIFQIRRMSIKEATQSLNLTVAQTATLAVDLRLLFLFTPKR